LEEEEKQHLLKIIEVSKRKVSSCEGEHKDCEEAFREEKRKLRHRLAYSKEDIPDVFLRSPEEQIDPITRRLIINNEGYSK